MKKMLMGLVVIALVGAAVWYAFNGGQRDSGKQFGQAVSSDVVPIGDIQREPAKYLGKVVTVEGTITKECPSSGCWWYIKDETGEIRADSFGSGFAITLKQEGKPIITTGKVVKTDSGELQLGATGAALK